MIDDKLDHRPFDENYKWKLAKNWWFLCNSRWFVFHVN